MALVIKKRLSLEFLGEEYKDSFIILKSLTMQEYDDLSGKDKDKTVREVVTDHFISGKIAQEGELVDIEPDKINELSPDIFKAIWGSLVGKLDPKEQGL